MTCAYIVRIQMLWPVSYLIPCFPERRAGGSTNRAENLHLNHRDPASACGAARKGYPIGTACLAKSPTRMVARSNQSWVVVSTRG